MNSLEAAVKPVSDKFACVRERVLAAIPKNSKLKFLSPAAGHVLKKRGKYLRPALVLLSCGLCGEDPGQAVEYAAVMELIHIGSLVFDDVLDGSELRRGRGTINALWGEKTAYLAGTHMLLESANRIAFENKRVREVAIHTMNAMFQGEVLQFQSLEKFNLDEETYMEIIKGKSASAMSACCRLGALAAGDQKREDIMGQFGLELGTAFQIRDDVLDLVADPKKLGKEPGSDLKDARMTLPMIHCVRNLNRSERSFLKKSFGLNGGRKIDLKKVNQIMDRTGSLSFCMEKAHELADMALSRLREFKQSEYRDSLEALCHFAVERDY